MFDCILLKTGFRSRIKGQKQMRHDVEKLRRFIQFVERQNITDAYSEILNNWLMESAFYIDQEELQYYMNLIPMIQERKKKRVAETQECEKLATE